MCRVAGSLERASLQEIGDLSNRCPLKIKAVGRASHYMEHLTTIFLSRYKRVRP